MRDSRHPCDGKHAPDRSALLSLPGRRIPCDTVAALASASWIAVYDFHPDRSLFLLQDGTDGFRYPASLSSAEPPWKDLAGDGSAAFALIEPPLPPAGEVPLPAGQLIAVPIFLNAAGGIFSLYLLGYDHDTSPLTPASPMALNVKNVILCCENNRFHANANRFMLRFFGLLSALSRELTDFSDTLDLMDTLAELLTRHLDAVAGCISLEASELIDQEIPSYILFPPERQAVIRSLLGSEAPTEVSIEELPGIPDSSSHAEEAVPFEVPLRHQGRNLGRIIFWVPLDISRELSLYLGEGATFLSELSEEIGLRVMNLRLLRRSERLVLERQNRLQELWILQETNNALRGTLEINRILKMILAGATVESGLGFNRAALLLLNEKTALLQGMLGVGPESREDAERIWSELRDDFDQPLALQIERYAETQPPSSFDSIVKSIRVPLSGHDGLLARCIRERTHINVADASAAPGLEGVLFRRLSLIAFAAVPIVARDRVFGVMVVDNRFDGKEITSENVRLLAMFAEQAGLAIANAKEHRAHRRAAEELRIARDQLVQTERLAVLGEVAANLAHEIRNPLVTIGGFARRLARKTSDRDPSGKYASVIAAEVERLELFLEEILLFGKDRAPNRQPLSLAVVINETIQLFAAGFAEAGIEVKKFFPEDLPLLSADAGQLKQVFINIFTNAMDVMPQGGKLRITASLSEDETSMVAVTVEDTGGGVDPDVLGSIFNPFFTTKSGGHGLGLSLTQRIVSAHGGRIHVRNTPGEGLMFIITLPIEYDAGRARKGGPVRVTQSHGGVISEDDTRR